MSEDCLHCKISRTIVQSGTTDARLILTALCEVMADVCQKADNERTRQDAAAFARGISESFLALVYTDMWKEYKAGNIDIQLLTNEVTPSARSH